MLPSATEMLRWTVKNQVFSYLFKIYRQVLSYYLEYLLLKAEEWTSLFERAPCYSGSFLMELGLVLPLVSSTKGLAMLNLALASCDDACAVLGSERCPGRLQLQE